MCIIAAESASQSDADIVIYVTSLVTNAKSLLLLLLYNMPLTFLHYVNNSIKTQIQSQKLELFKILFIYFS